MTDTDFFEMCCRRSNVEATKRQYRSFLKKEGSAYMYAKMSGNQCRADKLIKGAA